MSQNIQNSVISVFESVNSYKEYNIKTIKVGEIVWFKGKNVAEILEYKKTEKAISTHVRPYV